MTRRHKPFSHVVAPVAAPQRPEYEPTYTLQAHIDRARAEIGKARWAELNAEWNNA